MTVHDKPWTVEVQEGGAEIAAFIDAQLEARRSAPALAELMTFDPANPTATPPEPPAAA